MALTKNPANTTINLNTTSVVGGDLSGSLPNPEVIAFHSGTQQITFDNIIDGELLQRSGSVIISKAVSAGGGLILGTTPAQDISTIGATGTSGSAAPLDHIHAHGNMAGGTLHAEVTSASAGFQSTTSFANTNAHIANGLIHFASGSIPHADIIGVGTNTHTQLDTHVANGLIHFASGSIPHADIIGIGTNAHSVIDTHLANGLIHYASGSIVHQDISGAGSNTHAQLDTHVVNTDIHTANGLIHYTSGTIPHADIIGVGTNTHSVIDTHIADGTIHFASGSIPHADISGLSADDHIQYTLANGTRAFSGNISFGTNNILNVGDIGIQTINGITSSLLGTIEVRATGSNILSGSGFINFIGDAVQSVSISGNGVDINIITGSAGGGGSSNLTEFDAVMASRMFG